MGVFLQPGKCGRVLERRLHVGLRALQLADVYGKPGMVLGVARRCDPTGSRFGTAVPTDGPREKGLPGSPWSGNPRSVRAPHLPAARPSAWPGTRERHRGAVARPGRCSIPPRVGQGFLGLFECQMADKGRHADCSAYGVFFITRVAAPAPRSSAGGGDGLHDAHAHGESQETSTSSRSRASRPASPSRRTHQGLSFGEVEESSRPTIVAGKDAIDGIRERIQGQGFGKLRQGRRASRPRPACSRWP